MKQANVSTETTGQDRLAGLKPSDLNNAEKLSAVALTVFFHNHPSGAPRSA